MESLHNPHDLKDLVTNVLDGQGVLAKMRAQLRAEVYTVLMQSDKKPKPPVSNLASLKQSPNGDLLIQLILECLEFCGLEHTKRVLVMEADLGNVSYEGKPALVTRLNLNPKTSQELPLLAYSLGSVQPNTHTCDIGTQSAPISDDVPAASLTSWASPTWQESIEDPMAAWPTKDDSLATVSMTSVASAPSALNGRLVGLNNSQNASHYSSQNASQNISTQSAKVPLGLGLTDDDLSIMGADSKNTSFKYATNGGKKNVPIIDASDESQELDESVDSLALEELDYVENVYR
eukprot:Platyproteum_vivax@DN6736_c0_g1_i1.p1